MILSIKSLIYIEIQQSWYGKLDQSSLDKAQDVWFLKDKRIKMLMKIMSTHFKLEKLFN